MYPEARASVIRSKCVCLCGPPATLPAGWTGSGDLAELPPNPGCAVSGLAVPAEPQPSSTSCQNPSGSVPIHELVATGVDCAAASGVAGAWASAGTSCQTRTCSAAGFSCTSSQRLPSAEFLSVRCVSGNETVTFDSGG